MNFKRIIKLDLAAKDPKVARLSIDNKSIRRNYYNINIKQELDHKVVNIDLSLTNGEVIEFLHLGIDPPIYIVDGDNLMFLGLESWPSTIVKIFDLLQNNSKDLKMKPSTYAWN